MGFNRIVLLVLIATNLVAPALACSPPAPPMPPAAPAETSKPDADALAEAWRQAWWQRDDEEQRARRLKEQTRLFDEAASVAVVRYDRADKVSGMPPEFAYMNGGAVAILKPVRWVKGTGAPEELSVGRGFAPQCGWVPANDALNGKPGDVFLIYLGEDRHVMDGYKLDRIVEPRTLAALTTE